MDHLLSRYDIYDLIQKCRSDFVRDLQNDVIEYLHQQQLLSDLEYSHIINHRHRENRITALLELLPDKGNDVFRPFIHFVNNTYSWILEEFKLKSLDGYSEDKLKESLMQGGVPTVPQRHVSRKDLVADLRDKLHNLKRGEFVVVIGMRGCGKSTLVADALNSHSLIFDAFNGNVHWFNVSREISADEFALESELFSRFIEYDGLTNSSQVPQLDVVSKAHYLQKLLKSDRYKDILLVLDDVTSSSIIKAFEKISCKKLVTTHDRSIMNDTANLTKYVTVDSWFTEEETLQFFKKCLGSDKLPDQARTLHTICKGFPMTVSLIGSQLEQFKEDALSNTKRWDFYIDKLNRSGVADAIGKYDKSGLIKWESLYSAIGMCIDSLDDRLKIYYQDFALFLSDVNINSKVLSTLWDVDIKEVEDIMLEFEKKSLAVRLWNRHLNTYVYSIHDLLLDYLKRQLTVEEKQKLHLKLIDRYKEKYKGDYLYFPSDDNYILLYLAHHLKESNSVEHFPKLYTDLKYIENKLRANGPADVLLDYKKYKQFICNNDENSKKCEDFEWFVKWAGVRIYNSASDIIQFGLQERKDSFVYKQAFSLAVASNRKYFGFSTEPPKELLAPSYYHSREEIVTAIFTGIDENVLISNVAGDIKLVNVKTGITLATYKGHKDKVTRLSLSPFTTTFLSASDDSTVRIWNLNSFAAGEPEYPEKPRTPSPSFKQDEWLDAFQRTRSSGEKAVSVLTGHNKAVTDARYSNSGKWIVTASQDRTVRVWTICIDQVLGKPMVIKTLDVPVSCCFTNDNTLVVCGLKNRVILYSITNGSEYANMVTEPVFKSLTIVPGEQCKVLLMGRDYITVYPIKSTNSGNKSVLSNGQSYNSISHKRDEQDYICTSVSSDGKYVAVASTNYSTVIYNVNDGRIVAKFHEINGITRSLSWSFRSLVLLAAYDNKTLKLWNVEYNSTLRNAVKLRHNMFDALWFKNTNDDTVEINEYFMVAAVTNRNTIQVFCNEENVQSIDPVEKREINAIALSPCDGYLFYSCSDGAVHSVSTNTYEIHHLFRVRNNNCCKLKVFLHQSQLLHIFAFNKYAEDDCHLDMFKQQNSENLKGEVISFKFGKYKIFDFCLHPLEDRLYVVLDDHTIQIYNSINGSLLAQHGASYGYEGLTCCDFSLDAGWICTVNPRCIMLHRPSINYRVINENNSKHKPTACRFSHDGKYVAVGFQNGLVDITDVGADEKICSSDELTSSSIKNIIWSSDDEHLLLMLDREIILTNRNLLFIESLVYLFVDKIVPSHSFDKFVTIDNIGHLHILKHPL